MYEDTPYAFWQYLAVIIGGNAAVVLALWVLHGMFS